MGIRPLIFTLLTFFAFNAFAQRQAVTVPPGYPFKLDLGLNVRTNTQGTWGTGANQQTGNFTLSGGLYASSPTGEHLLINSANIHTISSVGTRGNVLALRASGGMASAARFLRASDGGEVGAVGYFEGVAGSPWYADNCVYLSASMPYALADGAHPADGTPPPNLILAQEGFFNGGFVTSARLKFDTSWNFGIYRPDTGDPQLTVTAFGRVGIGGWATGSNYLDIYTNDIGSGQVRVTNANNGVNAGAQFLAQSASGNTATLASYGSGFSYHAYPSNGSALISNGSGGMSLFSTSGGSLISFYVGGDTSASLAMSLGSGGLTVPAALAVGGGAAVQKILSTTATWAPPSLGNGASAKDTGVTLTGVSPGDVVTASLSTITSSDWAVQACVTSANTVEVKITNNTGGTVGLPSGTLRVNCVKF